MIDEAGKRNAIQKCEATTMNAVGFYKPKKSKVISARWNGKVLLTIQDMMRWKLDKNGGFRVDGMHRKDEDAMLFDLNTATKLK